MTPDPFAKKPDTTVLVMKLQRNDLTHAEAIAALRQCVDYIDRIEMSLDELRAKCVETAMVLRD